MTGTDHDGDADPFGGPAAADNPFDIDLPAYVAPEDIERPQGKSGRRRHRPDVDPAIGVDPEYWTPPVEEELPPPERPGAPGFHGDWDQWAQDLRAQQAARVYDVDPPEPQIPRLKDFGGGGPVVRGRRARREFDDGRVDGGRRGLAVVAIIGALTAVVGAVIAVNVFATSSDTAAATGITASAPVRSSAGSTTARPGTVATPPAYATADCTTVRTPSLTSGAVDGDTSTAQNTILGFEFAYYVRRDASKARSYATADAKIGSEAAIARGIADTPTAARYCVYITPAGAPGVWTVNLHQQFPDEPVEKIAHRITTREVSPGSHRIVEIARG